MSAHPTKKRQSIANLKAALAGISIDAGYLTDVATVSDDVREWETAKQHGAWPWIGIMPGRVRTEPSPSREFRCIVPIEVVCHVGAPTKQEAYDKLEDLLDDVLAAVLADPRRGIWTADTQQSNAVTTRYLGEETDEGDPDWMDSRGGTASMIVHFEIVYYRGLTAQATEGE